MNTRRNKRVQSRRNKSRSVRKVRKMSTGIKLTATKRATKRAILKRHALHNARAQFASFGAV